MEQTANRNAGERTVSPLAGKPAPASILVDLRQLEAAYYERTPDPDDPTQLVSFGTSGHRGSSLRGSFTEAHIARHHAGDLRVPPRAGDRRSALHGQGHARAVASRAAHRPRSARGQRCRDRHSARGRRHADAGHLAGHPRLQPRPHGPPGRRHRHHAVAQSAGRRRLQIQPAQRRPRRYRRHRAGSRTAPTSCCAAGIAG